MRVPLLVCRNSERGSRPRNCFRIVPFPRFFVLETANERSFGPRTAVTAAPARTRTRLAWSRGEKERLGLLGVFIRAPGARSRTQETAKLRVKSQLFAVLDVQQTRRSGQCIQRRSVGRRFVSLSCRYLSFEPVPLPTSSESSESQAQKRKS